MRFGLVSGCQSQRGRHAISLKWLGNHAQSRDGCRADLRRISSDVDDAHAIIRRQIHTDRRTCWAITQVKINQRDVASGSSLQCSGSIGGNGCNLEPCILDDLFDFQSNENLVFNNQYFLTHHIVREVADR